MRDLRDFIKLTRDRGWLTVVDAPVDPELVITEIADRVVKKRGPALLFERVSRVGDAGGDQPVRPNARVMRALGVDDWKSWTERLDFFLEPKMPTSLLDKVRTLPKLLEVAGIFPKTVKDGPVHEVVKVGDQVDLGGSRCCSAGRRTAAAS